VKASLTPTGEIIPFSAISIGKIFFYNDRFWVRTSSTAGTDISEGKGDYGSCSFSVTEDTISKNAEPAGWLNVERVAVTYS
jgi:hypothetical protein